MINAVHLLIYTTDAEADRAFLRDVLELPYVDDGVGWLIFKLPPAEVAVHPTEGAPQYEMHLMCDDLDATIAELTAKGVELAAPVTERSYGITTEIRLPGGGTVGLYQPRHALAYTL